MSRRLSFRDLAKALQESEWVDDAVMALSKTERGKPLNSRDSTAIEAAIRFLEEVKSGTTWLQQESPVIDPNSRKAIASFVKAADSFGSSRSKDRFFEDLDALLRTAKSLPTTDDPKALHNLRQFFSNLLGTSLQNIDAAFSTNPFAPPTFVQTCLTMFE
jgi:non-homologous end joining protein Ku